MTGEEIKRLRLDLDDTRHEFAERLGVSFHTVTSWEVGRLRPNGPSLRLMTALRRELDTGEPQFITTLVI